MNTIPIVYTNDWEEYKLLDSGGGEKLESFAGYTMIRPDPRAIWSHRTPQSSWDNADATFIRTDSEHGNWNVKKQTPNPWTLTYHDLKFKLHPTDFKHVGIFPEQATNWNWIQKQINTQGAQSSILNLFGYTGAATVAAAKAGAHVTHVDSSKPSITWAHENCDLNAIPPAQTRWIVEDAYKFVLNETKRKSQYAGIILDPPRFGRGAKGEIWKLTEDLPNLLYAIKKILRPTNAFVLLNVYTADLSTLAIYNLIENVFAPMHGTCEIGELATKEENSDRFLSQGIVARWKNN
jgi:23S rRNA (cytosine1962-C5)-methyltransferase